MNSLWGVNHVTVTGHVRASFHYCGKISDDGKIPRQEIQESVSDSRIPFFQNPLPRIFLENTTPRGRQGERGTGEGR